MARQVLRLPPEYRKQFEVMSEEEVYDWFETKYDDVVKQMSVEDQLYVAKGHCEVARRLLEARMVEVGFTWSCYAYGENLYHAPCCGSRYAWDRVEHALEHVRHSPCPHGFTILEGKCVCDCKRKCDSPKEALAHQDRIGNCLEERRRRQRLFCTLCEHQSDTKKEHEAHTQSKTHIKKANPVVLVCEVCEVSCRTRKEYERHCQGKLHLFRTDPATRPNLTCSVCKTTCSSQRNMDAHLLTAKHLKKTTSVCVVE